MISNFETKRELKPLSFATWEKYCVYLLLVSTVTILSFGCGGPGPGSDKTSVSGIVKFNGEPLQAGMITFVLEEDARWRVTTTIREGGKFKVLNAPKGKVLVGIDTEIFAGEDVYTKIPSEYGNPKTSGIVWEIVPGADPKTFELEDK